MTKPCPVCGYAFSFWYILRRGSVLARWNCPRCDSRLGYDQNRAALGLLLLIALWYFGPRLVDPTLRWVIQVPFALSLAMLYVLAEFWLQRLAVIERKGGFCKHCGYDLTGNTTGRCPECGEAV